LSAADDGSMPALGDPRFPGTLEMLQRRLSGHAPAGPHREALTEDLQTAYEELRVADEEVRTLRDQLGELGQHQESQRRQHERMLALLPVPIVTTDANGVIRSANAPVAALTGMPVAYLIGKPMQSWAIAEDRSALRRFINDVKKRPELRHTMTLSRPRGNTVRVECFVDVSPAPEHVWDWILLTVPEGAVPSSASDRLARGLTRLAALPATVTERQEVLQHSCRIVADALGPDLFVSVNEGHPAAPTGLASSGLLAQAMDGAQMAAGEGPCVTAFAERSVVVSDRVGTDPRWPRLRPHVPEGVGGAIAVPLEVGESLVGALNVYSAGPTPAETVEAARLTGVAIAAVMYEMGLRSELHATAADLKQALVSRATIDQAKGIIMATRRCTADEAFEHLAGLSSTTNTKLRDVARMLVERYSRP